MKNIILTMSMILIPFIALAGSIEEINKLMDRIKTNTESYRLICYKNSAGKWFFDLELNKKKEYCAYLKTTIEHDINEVLEMEHGK